MTPMTLLFAMLAGAGAGLAWGYRTALNVAMERLREGQPPREPHTATLLPVGGRRDKEEYGR